MKLLLALIFLAGLVAAKDAGSKRLVSDLKLAVNKVKKLDKHGKEALAKVLSHIQSDEDVLGNDLMRAFEHIKNRVEVNGNVIINDIEDIMGLGGNMAQDVISILNILGVPFPKALLSTTPATNG